MMGREEIIELTRSSLREPRAAAQTIMSMNLGRDVLWTALALVAAINTFVLVVVVTASTPAFPLPGYFDKPLTMFVLIAGLMVVYVHAIYWSGLAIGGQGHLMDVVAVVVWFQLLRAVAQVAIVLLSLAIPAAGTLLSFVVAIWGLWMFLNFIAAALNLNSAWHAVAVVAVAFAGLVIGLGTLMALIGGFAQGVLN